MSNAALRLQTTHSHRLRLLPMTDDSERRDTPTDAAPPPSEPQRRTQPPGHHDAEATRVMQTMLPGAPPSPYQAPPTWWEGSFFQSMFNKLEGGFEALGKATSGQDEILKAIERADRNQTSNYELLRDEIRHLKDSDIKQDRRLAEGDKRFEQIEQSIADLKDELIALVTREMKTAADKIEALEKLLEQARADAPAARSTTPEAPQPT